MIKQVRKLTAILAVSSLFFVASCGNDDNGGGSSDDDTIEVTELSGNLEEDLMLDPDIAYQLTGTYTVKSGVTLTIPAGTEITVDTDAGAGATDLYIVGEQGSTINVNGTSAEPVVMKSSNGEAGDWGGLVLLGEATTTEGVDAIAEVGGLIYGGTDDADSSGSISYLIMEGTGAQINSESQFNGLTLYAVGSGTTISHIAIINGADDGIEFFGGTVSASNIYLENLEDDAIDWTEGWNGTLSNTYVLHTLEGFSTALEADGVNGNPTIENFTAASTVGGVALQFKKESGATITGLSLSGYDTSLDFADDGAVANVQIEETDANPALSYFAAPTVEITDFAWATSNTSTDDYTILEGNITDTVTLDASVDYLLDGAYVVQDGGKLVIPAGTKITVSEGGTSVYIAVLQGGQIEINGTTDAPVVISSLSQSPGGWGGLTICGEATTTEGVDATAEVGGFIYGGTADDDNSGIIENLVIIGTGAQINSESQYNGISFYAVGSGTTVNNIAVINGADDGVEFFGGSVNATNLYLENNEDDAVDWTEGWNGTVTDTYVSHTVAGFSTAVEADGVNENPSLVNFTAVSSVDGTALQFKKESGATITNIYLEGYTTDIEFANDGDPANVQVDDNDSDAADYDAGTPVDVSGWTWKDATL
ncbi:hypothetical protein [Aquimarina pacifica]|uniref:hypothetical protein n=1 Tax=Aquimarina pacifica TaxID=1296415 RepID=UPI00046E6775|nr:hypothetical protein [Aquimarina pacifica]